MSKEIKLPELGENIETADVVSILVKPGDTIEKEQGLIEIETDKATIEVPSTSSGKVKEVLVKQGEKVKTGQTIIYLEDGEETKASPSKEEKSKKEPAREKKEVKAKADVKPEVEKKAEAKKSEPVQTAAKTEISELKLPELGENITSADIVNVLVKNGDFIEKDQAILEIETDKATIEVPSTLTGKITQVLVKAGDKATVGQVLLKISAETKPEEKPAEKEKPEAKEATGKALRKAEEEKEEGKKEEIPAGETVASIIEHQPPILKGAAPAAPSVRRIARELGVDINKVPGSGPSGRISMDDVKSFVKKINEERDGKTGIGVKQEALPDFSKFGEVERKAMSNIRSKTADHMSYAWISIPHVTQHDKADITELEKIRKEFNPRVEKAGGKLTVTAILIKVITGALKVFPQFNSSIDMEKKEIIYKKYFNIGVAVDTEHGLIVPVIKDADKKNLIEISVELAALADKARNRKISLDELQGGCFTITNLGGIGGTSFTPIVNVPEVSILGVSRGSYEPVFAPDGEGGNGRLEPRLMLPLSLSYDHRIIDGANAARFLRWVCETLEQPMKLLVEG
ncbi:MAG TPA: dihydrolipoyllysine-residue acetyltransferase [Ignavibacteriaceae bacterium]|nr:dihydrolipoyllysine-residue acetyltransferase [Ignavibacteriaceae bacterium]